MFSEGRCGQYVHEHTYDYIYKGKDIQTYCKGFAITLICMWISDTLAEEAKPNVCIS